MPFRSPNRLDSLAPTVAIVGFLAIVGATLGVVIFSRPGVWSPRVNDPIARVSAAAAETVPTGTAVIDAVPWGEVARIVSNTGEQWTLPADVSTPLVLELPAGTWTIALTHPEAEEERLCEVTLGEGVSIECLAEFEPLSVDQYFRDAGWWQ